MSRREVEEQLLSNRSGLAHHDSFRGHRQRLTRLVRSRAGDQGGRLCVLGAGNCHDLDLAELGQVYSEIHLVDLDRDALEGARERAGGAAKARIELHAPLDVSGVFDRLEAWGRFEVTPEELMGSPERASSRVASVLPGPFDVVVSACLLSQLQLALLHVLGSEHRLFAAARQILNLIHLRLLAKLAGRTGRALFVTDVVSNATYPIETLDPEADHRSLLESLCAQGNAIYAVNPRLMAETSREDPFLKRSVVLSPPLDAWIWNNGNERSFIVYALEVTPR